MTKTAALLGVILIATACAGVSQSNLHTTDSGLQYIDPLV